MKKFITFGSIDQFRNVIRSVSNHARYEGLDEDGVPIYNSDPLPIVKAIGTEKIHGTNGGVCYNSDAGMWVQSRKNIITPEKDNAGFAQFVHENNDEWQEIIDILAIVNDIDLAKNTIAVFCEWAGGSIQKSSACAGMDKMAFLFEHFKVVPHDDEEAAYWLKTDQVSRTESWIYNIENFPTYEFEIDFNNPAMSVNEFIKVVEETVEPNSPVGKALGIDGNIGEGIVVTFEFKGIVYRFKVKGDKHSKTKVKKLKPVDETHEAAKIEFVNTHACKGWRLQQAWSEVYSDDTKEVHMKHVGDFLRWLINDVHKEESIHLEELSLTPKDVNSMISAVAKDWYVDKMNGRHDEKGQIE